MLIQKIYNPQVDLDRDELRERSNTVSVESEECKFNTFASACPRDTRRLGLRMKSELRFGLGLIIVLF